jgi:competence protein ComEA
MRRAGLWLGIVAGGLMLGMGAAGALDLPPGPNRDLVVHECQACHSLDMVAASNETKETWNILLDSMTSYGLRVSPEERAKILDYLSTALGPKPAP